ncbi:MAG: DUF3179 domain-containing protein [Proteobacteria bacterium]|nr:DUF3179 domain-containing protein [Pseudomonadota bacterium]
MPLRRLALLLAAWLGLGASPLLAAPLAEGPAQARLAELVSGTPETVARALAQLGASGDRRFIAPLVELLRADEVGAVQGIDRSQLVSTLASLAGTDLGDDWPEWVRFVTRENPGKPPGFTGWKGRLLARIDPRFGPLLASGIPSRIRTEEIIWGGVAFEGIPALDRPATLPASEAHELSDTDAVFGLVVNGDARAYPLRILDWHELVNDVVGEVPVSLAYCTLCGSGIAYDGRGPGGRSFDFGSSGFLMRSNKLMVDRQTLSLWNQFTGRPVVGPLVEEDDFRLRVLPSVVTTWGEWRRRHPDTRVLSFDTGHRRPYHAGAAYGDYFASERTMFPIARRNRALPDKTRVFALEREGQPKAYPIEALVAARVTNDRVGATDVVLVANAAPVRVAGRSVRSGRERQYRAGAAVRAYRRGAHRFSSGEAGQPVDERGRPWRVTEAALEGPDGAHLERLPGVLAYWFAWAAFHPQTELAGSPTPRREP